jgi:polar amino acid transport system ATP-binding protein
VTDPRHVLRFEDVRKSYGAEEVLEGITLAVGTHEVVCLIGASGSGKSTLLKCANLIEPVSSGRILFEEEEISRPGVESTTSAATSASSFRPSTSSPT